MSVAPHVGAWIEIVQYCSIAEANLVAPHVGAWIEMLMPTTMATLTGSRTSRRCVD